jgi:predicted RNase H-like nuclease (RuvC/YqgF family)
MSNLTELQNEIMKSINVAAINGTLTNEAVSHFKKIVDESQDMKGRIDYLEEELKNKKMEANKYKLENEEFMLRKQSIEKREADVSIREKEITKLECSLTGAMDRVKDHKEMFSVVFRNTEVRRDMFTAVNGGDNYDGKRNAGWVSRDEQKETIE